ncbi:hypothetical protein DUNSADRAFT_8210, partial [Dunaliella salina]
MHLVSLLRVAARRARKTGTLSWKMAWRMVRRGSETTLWRASSRATGRGGGVQRGSCRRSGSSGGATAAAQSARDLALWWTAATSATRRASRWPSSAAAAWPSCRRPPSCSSSTYPTWQLCMPWWPTSGTVTSQWRRVARAGLRLWVLQAGVRTTMAATRKGAVVVGMVWAACVTSMICCCWRACIWRPAGPRL